LFQKYFSTFTSITMQIKFAKNNIAMYEVLTTLHPGEIRTHVLLLVWRSRWPLHHAIRAQSFLYNSNRKHLSVRDQFVQRPFMESKIRL
jgi:hypothetical protein